MKNLTVKQSRFRDCGFRSKGEKDMALDLESQLRRGIVKRWQFEQHIPLVVKGKKVCEIWPDFLIEYPDGRLKVIEVKGGKLMKSKWWALKRELFKALFPHVEYVTHDTFYRKKRNEKIKTWKDFVKKNSARVIQFD